MTRHQQGFTLAELLVVLAIVALTSALAFPLAGTSNHKGDLETATAAVAAGLRLARFEAIGGNRETQLHVEFKSRTIVRDGQTVISVVPSGIAIEAVSARGEALTDDAAFRFFPDGSATGGSITLTGGRERRALRVNWVTGAVTLSVEKVQ